MVTVKSVSAKDSCCPDMVHLTVKVSDRKPHREFHPTALFEYWLDESGSLVAFAALDPESHFFDGAYADDELGREMDAFGPYLYESKALSFAALMDRLNEQYRLARWVPPADM